MSPRQRPRSSRGPHPVAFAASAALLWAALVVAIAGCGGSAATFDPAGLCTADARLPGAYPALEALVPVTFRDRPPDRLDSGRNCTSDNLGSLQADGIREVRFAGGLWELGAESGVTLAVFEGDGLSPEALGRFYETGARAGRKTADIDSRAATIQGRSGWRIDLVNNEQPQTIVVWPSRDGARLQVALVGTAARDVGGDRAAHDRVVDEAIAAFR